MPRTPLTSLLAENRLADFFRAWPQTVHPTSPLNGTLRSLQADWNQALDEFIKGNTEDDGSKSIREKAFALVDRITWGDLEEAKTETPPPPSARQPDTELKALMEEKLLFLKRSRLLAIDPSAQFMLDKQIKELETQLGL